MEKVTVKKLELLNIVRENRAQHRAKFEAAVEGYRKACITVFEENLKKFLAGKAERVFINEQMPEDHTDDYDVVLEMLEMSVDDEITITTKAFNNYVRDKWDWSDRWVTSNSKYL